MLAHNAAVMGIPIDPKALYESDDPSYIVWLQTLAERVKQTLEESR